jgi:glucose dehydrogenase/mono/diheme cytochrome c family protein
MNRTQRGAVIVSLALVAILFVVAGCGGSGGTTTTESSSTNSAPEGPSESTETAETAEEWAFPNANAQQTRYLEGPINSSNVAELKPAWRIPLKVKTATFGAFFATPVVSEGVVYAQDSESNVYAIDLETGKILWTKKYNSPDVGPNGVTVGDGIVFGATGSSAFALDAESGEQLWMKKIVRNDKEGIDMAPGYSEGTVYVSTVPGNAKGFYAGEGQAILWAMDAKTGATKWKFDEVPKGLWGNPKVNSGGGLWEPPTIGPEGNVYAAVSNPAPFPGAPKEPWGESRPGANLYTDSIVKLEGETGKVMWHYQLTPHDIQDHDLQNAPALTTVGGKEAILAAGKAGIAITLDAETGKLLWKTPIGKHNGHDNDNLYALHHEYSKLPKSGEPYVVEPGDVGGVESQFATDGEQAIFPVVNVATDLSTLATNLEDAKGELVSLDQETGKLKWATPLPQAPYGAATVTGDLVFTTTFEGSVWALDTETGKIVWHEKLPAGTNAPPAVSGDTLIVAASFPQAAGEIPELIAYRLGASGVPPLKAAGEPETEKTKSSEPEAEKTKSTEPSGEESAGAASAEAGQAVFSQNCATCHTLAAAGSKGTTGPNLDELEPSESIVQKQVTNGGGGMPAFGSTLSKTEIESVAKYVSSVAGKPLTPAEKKQAEESGGGATP